MHFSSDGGETWTESTLPLGQTCCDPTIDYKSDGSFVYAATLGGCGFLCNIWFYRSSDNGQTWDDLATVTPGPTHADSSPTPTRATRSSCTSTSTPDSPHRDNIYLTWHDNNVMQFARSTDDGNPFDVRSTQEGRKHRRRHHDRQERRRLPLLAEHRHGEDSTGALGRRRSELRFDHDGCRHQRWFRLCGARDGHAPGVHLRLG